MQYRNATPYSVLREPERVFSAMVRDIENGQREWTPDKKKMKIGRGDRTGRKGMRKVYEMTHKMLVMVPIMWQ